MRIIFRLALLSTLLFALTACLSGLNLREGIISFRNQDYRQAFIRLKPEAIKGNPDAEYAIGYMYYYGRGVVEDKRKAKIWISKAARVGHPEAVQALKILYCNRAKTQKKYGLPTDAILQR